MIRYTVRTMAGFFKIECDIRDFEEALRIVRKRQKNADAEIPTSKNDSTIQIGSEWIRDDGREMVVELIEGDIAWARSKESGMVGEYLIKDFGETFKEKNKWVKQQ